MSIFSKVGHFLGNLVGIDDQEEKRKKQQQQAQQQQQSAPASARQNTQDQGQNQNQQGPVIQQPDNGVSLVVSTKKKTAPTGLVDKLPRIDAPQPQPAAEQPSALKRVEKFAIEKAAPAVGHAIDEGVNRTLQAVPGVTLAGPALKRFIPKNVQEAIPKPSELVGGTLRATAQAGARTANTVMGTELTPVGEGEQFLLGKRPVGQFKDYTKDNFGRKTGNKIADTAIGVAGTALDAVPVALPKQTAKGAGNVVERTIESTGLRKAAEEVAPGVHSVNPNREADAAAHVAQQAQKEAEQARIAQAAQEAAAPKSRETTFPAPEPPAQAALDVPTFQRNNADQLVAAAQNKVNTLDSLPKNILPDNQATRLAQKQELTAAIAQNPKAAADVMHAQLLRRATGATDPQAAIDGLAPLRERANAELVNAQSVRDARDALAPTEVTPPPVESAAPAVDALPTPEAAPAPVPAPEVASVAQPAPEVAATPPVEAAPVAADSPVPTVPELGGAPTANVAPLSHDALVKQLGPAAEGLKGKYSKKLPLNIEELKQNADGVIANMSDEQLLKSFSTEGPDALVNDARSFSLARSALDRLSQNADDPHAVQTVVNLMDAMDRFVSKSGEGLRIAQESFDNMPLPMKVRYIAKKIDRANVDTKGYQPLSDDPARADVIETTLGAYLRGSQDISERISVIEGQLNNIAEAAKSGQPVEGNTKALAKTLKTEQRNLQASNGELIKYFNMLVPSRTKAQKLLSDFPRQMMLSSFTGRLNDLLTTSANVLNLGVNNVVQGALSVPINAVKKGALPNTLLGSKKVITGGIEGLRKTVGEFKGTQYSGDVARGLESNTEMRSGLKKATGVVGRSIQAATEAATRGSEGVRDQKLYQLADQEAAQAGLTGAARRVYAEARSAVPSRQMIEKADQLHKEINNLNENPVTRALNRVSVAIEGNDKTGIGGLIKNQIIPFTSWMGGNIWNSVTDKNVVASIIKFGRDVIKGDGEGAVTNLAKAITGAGQAYALGYSMSKLGLITNQNAEGYNDAGAYFHVGDRYIPVNVAGQWAPNIVLGNALFHGLHSPDGESPAAAVAKVISGYAWNGLAVGQALGTDNTLQRAVQAGNRPGASAVDGLAVAGGGAAGQFLPAAGTDVNAVLNNGLKIGGKTVIPDALNPTHEAANTKVVDPNSPSGTAKDPVKSAAASLQNRLPFASQQLPRKKDVAAPDLRDRVVRGDRDTAGGKQTKADAQKQVNHSKDLAARGVPDFKAKFADGNSFDSAVEARVENKKYDQAIEALQYKADEQSKNKDIPKSKVKVIQDQIKQIKVLKDGKYDPEIRDTYKSTSLSEWRDMGDPESDNYDPEQYQKLYDYDNDLAKQGISGSSLSKSKNKFTAKAPKKSGGKKGGGSGGGSSTAKSNTIGTTPDLGKVSLGALTQQKAGSTKIPIIADVKPGELIKKRAISVGKG